MDLSKLAEYGSVGVSIALILLLSYKILIDNQKDARRVEYEKEKDTLYNKTINNHLEHLDITLNKMNREQQRSNDNQIHVAGALDRNTRVIEKIIDKI